MLIKRAEGTDESAGHRAQSAPWKLYSAKDRETSK